MRVSHVAWAGDGSHLAWFGDEAARWNGTDGPVFAGWARTVGVARTDAAPASRTVSDRVRPWSSAVVTDDGRALLAGVNGGDEIHSDVTGLRTLDLTDPRSQFELHPWSTPEEGDRVDVLGLSPQGLPTVLWAAADTDIRDVDAKEPTPLVDSDAQFAPVLGGSPTLLLVDGDVARPLSTVAGGSRQVRLTVATDLADDQSTAFAEPRSPASDERKVVVGTVGAALLAQLVSLAAQWRRRRQPSRATTPPPAAP